MQLYLRKHKIGLDGSDSGTKYLGYSKDHTKRDYRYKKTVWAIHLNKYGHEYETEILYDGDDQELLENHAVAYSLVHKIWDNPEFANQMMETGKTGSAKARYRSKEALENIKKRGEANKGRVASDASRKKMSESSKGAVFSEEHCRKLSESGMGRVNSPEARAKMSATQKARGNQKGSKNPASRPVTFQGVDYSYLKEAEIKTGVSLYKIRKELRNPNIINSYYKEK